jgi:hypothetical protein
VACQGLAVSLFRRATLAELGGRPLAGSLAEGFLRSAAVSRLGSEVRHPCEKSERSEESSVAGKLTSLSSLNSQGISVLESLTGAAPAAAHHPEGIHRMPFRAARSDQDRRRPPHQRVWNFFAF